MKRRHAGRKGNRLILRIFLVVLVTLSAGRAPSLADTQTENIVRLGVLAFRGKDDAVARWTSTAEYLSQTVAGTKFTVVPLTLAETAAAVALGDVDFILTNTGNYVDLEARFGISRIATIRAPTGVEIGNLFGAVIFTRADRDDIRTLKDLKGKSFVAVQEEGFGGFQMAWRELKKNGIDPFADFSNLAFSGFPQDQVALIVLRGGADAGTFRTDTLEVMAAEGKIRLRDFKVLNPQNHHGFPYLASTRLYPEWPFAKVRGTSEALAQKVAIALLSMPPDSDAAKAGRYAGWTVPLDYQPVHELFRELRIGPYEELGEITPGDLFRQYGHWVAFLFLALAVSVAWATRIEVVVARRTKELREANEELERQVGERRKAEAEARQRQAELAHVSRLSIMGEMAAGFAHELNQPLAAIINYAQGCVRRLRTGSGPQEEVLDAMERVSEQATRAAEIIRRIRGFVRKEEQAHGSVDINALIRDVIGLMEGETERQGAAVHLRLAKNLPPALADPIQIEQAVLNLVRNGIEAMAESGKETRRVTVTTAAEDGGGVSVTVDDTGPGIPEEMLDTLFTPFITSKVRGLGLGLSISNTIIESHGGRLVAETTPEGARFRFTLPAAAEETDGRA